jgi:hypothetical protein
LLVEERMIDQDEKTHILEYARNLRDEPFTADTDILYRRMYGWKHIDPVIVPRRSGKSVAACVLMQYIEQHTGKTVAMTNLTEQQEIDYNQLMTHVKNVISTAGLDNQVDQKT